MLNPYLNTQNTASKSNVKYFKKKSFPNELLPNNINVFYQQNRKVQHTTLKGPVQQGPISTFGQKMSFDYYHI